MEHQCKVCRYQFEIIDKIKFKCEHSVNDNIKNCPYFKLK